MREIDWDSGSVTGAFSRHNAVKEFKGINTGSFLHI